MGFVEWWGVIQARGTYFAPRLIYLDLHLTQGFDGASENRRIMAQSMYWEGHFLEPTHTLLLGLTMCQLMLEGRRLFLKV